MAARAIGSGTISFGLVNIPVKLYAAAESAAQISFHQLHDKCKSRIKQQLWCPVDNEIVTRDHLVKGYEFARDQYVLFTAEELKALEEASTKAMEITEFVPLSSVDPLYFENGWYLGPDKGADRPYRLLAQALEQSQHAAIAKYSTRGREELVLIRPRQGALVMQALRYADELRPVSEVPVGEGEVKPAELQLAKQFIDQLSTDTFDASKYEDTYRKKLQAVIDQKIAGEPVSIAPAEPPRTQVIDLMEALKASLAKRGAPSAEAPAGGEAEPAVSTERKPPKRAPAPAAQAAAAKKRSKR
ncbi:MAG TPA: Ku protein [Myxococcaceae bacterium]|nr:Ku protein [Myxococcaceae bacterium]